MVLHAKKTKVPFVGLIGALVIMFSVLLWDFLRSEDFTPNAFAKLALLGAMVLVPVALIYLDFRRCQSIQIDDEGVRLELLSLPARPGVFPRFRETLLAWDEVKEVSIGGNIIKLRGLHRIVRINTFYFSDVASLFQLIERCYHRGNRG